MGACTLRPALAPDQYGGGCRGGVPSALAECAPCLLRSVFLAHLILPGESIFAMKKTYFPEAYSLRLPDGYRHRIDDAARESGMTPAEWIRNAVTRALNDHEKSRGGAVPEA